MKLFRISTLLSFVLAVLAGAVLFRVSQNVQQAEDNLAHLRKAITYEERTIHVLQAEWDYLNNPERLEKLAREHLDLVPVGIKQLMKDSSEDVIPAKAGARESQAVNPIPVFTGMTPNLLHEINEQREGH